MAKFICENCKKEYIRKGNLDKHIVTCKTSRLVESKGQEILDKVVEEEIQKQNKIEKPKTNKLSKEEIMEEINKESLDDFTNDDIKLLYGDCLKRMKELSDSSIDLILCDLPCLSSAS